MGQGETHQILVQMTRLTLAEWLGMGQGGTHQIMVQIWIQVGGCIHNFFSLLTLGYEDTYWNFQHCHCEHIQNS